MGGKVVDVRREAPEPWATWMIEAGVIDPRGRTPRPSMRELASRSGVTTTTISGMIHGDRHTEPATVAEVARVLGLDVREVSRQVGQARSVRDPYVMPDEVHLLSDQEQAALTRLIRAIAKERDLRGNTAPTKAAGDDPAPLIETRVLQPPPGPPSEASPRTAAGPRRRGQP